MAARNVYCVSSYRYSTVVNATIPYPTKIQLTSTVVAESSEKAKLLFKDHFKLQNNVFITCHFICQIDLYQQ